MLACHTGDPRVSLDAWDTAKPIWTWNLAGEKEAIGQDISSPYLIFEPPWPPPPTTFSAYGGNNNMITKFAYFVIKVSVNP